MRRQASVQGSKAMVVLAALAVLATGTSCSKMMPTAPSSAIPARSMKPGAQAASTTSNYAWVTLADKWVNKGETAAVAGGRYKVDFTRGSLSAGAQVAIQERDPALVDFVVGPMNTVCSSKATTMTISYASSNADVMVNGMIRVPNLYRLNESTGAWEAVAGTNDSVNKKFTAKVSVLGGYVLDFVDPGKGGW